MMAIRSRLKSAGLKLEIPERKVSPRDWNLPYQRPPASRWRFAAAMSPKQQNRLLKKSVFHFRTSSGVGSSVSGMATSTTTGDSLAHVLTPTDQLDGSSGDPLSGALEARRSSSGVLLSPDVIEQLKAAGAYGTLGGSGNDGGMTAGVTGSDDDAFFMLKKDSQRRKTLVLVLHHDRVGICRQWHNLLRKELPDTALSESNLQVLMDGLKSFISEQNKANLEAALTRLKEDLMLDASKINQLSTALWIFQDAINSTLRSHNIKPHWMFALDDLVRDAVKVAIRILSPELDPAEIDDPLLGRIPNQQQPGQHEPDGTSTSGVSTVNSTMAIAGGAVGGGGGGLGLIGGAAELQHAHLAAAAAAHAHQVQRGDILASTSHFSLQHEQLREENQRLLTQIVDVQKNFQELLRSTLAQYQAQFETMSAVSPIMPHPTHPPSQSEQGQPSGSSAPPDDELVRWLQDLSLSDQTIKQFVNQDLTYNDVVQLMSRDDLRRLGLRAGPELRVWRAISTARGGGEGSSEKHSTDKE